MEKSEYLDEKFEVQRVTENVSEDTTSSKEEGLSKNVTTANGGVSQLGTSDVNPNDDQQLEEVTKTLVHSRQNISIEDGIMNQISKVIVNDIIDTIHSDEEGSDAEHVLNQDESHDTSVGNTTGDIGSNHNSVCEESTGSVECIVENEGKDLDESVDLIPPRQVKIDDNIDEQDKLNEKIETGKLTEKKKACQKEIYDDGITVDKDITITEDVCQDLDAETIVIKEIGCVDSNCHDGDQNDLEEDQIIPNTLLPDRSRNPSSEVETIDNASENTTTITERNVDSSVSKTTIHLTTDESMQNIGGMIKEDYLENVSDSDEELIHEFRSQPNTTSCMQVPPPSPEPSNGHVFSCADLQSNDESEGGEDSDVDNRSPEPISNYNDNKNRYLPLRQLLKTAPRLERPPPHRYLSARALSEVRQMDPDASNLPRMTAQQCKRHRRREECAELMRRQRRLRDNLADLKHSIGAADRHLSESLRHSVKYRDACKDKVDQSQPSLVRANDSTSANDEGMTHSDEIESNVDVESVSRRSFALDRNSCNRYVAPRYGLVDIGRSTVRRIGCGLGKSGSVQTRYVVNKSYY